MLLILVHVCINVQFVEKPGFLLVSVLYVILCHALLSLVLKCACAILYHWFVFWQDANSFFVISREKRDNFILIKEIFKSKIHMEKFIVFYNKVKLI